MRLSNGANITFGSDNLGQAILIDGQLDNGVLSQAPEWTIWKDSNNVNDERRCWRITLGKTLERTSNQCPDDFFTFIKNALDKIETNVIHPALVNGFESEAKRLFPAISELANDEFLSFIQTLRTEFEINEETEKLKSMSKFVDDVGPALIVLVDKKPAILPEIPMVYFAPSDWVLSMWRINNHMVGPLLEAGLEEESEIQFPGLSIPPNELTLNQKGIYYFHMARFILFFEAWVGLSETPYLLEFFRIYKKGVRVLESVIK